ncbi:MAG: 50S ribosomal protein L10 [Polyangiaceae bacterium]
MASLANTKSAKTATIGEVKAKFDRMTSAVFLDYKGMTVETATKLRAQFKAAGIEYKVVKNTLVKQAIKDLPYGQDAALKKSLTGMTGIAWSYEDPSAAAKIVRNFKKDAGDAGAKIGVKAGILENEVLDGNRVENELANLPGKDELRAKLLATFQAPLQQFVALLQAPAQNFVYVLAAKEEKG